MILDVIAVAVVTLTLLVPVAMIVIIGGLVSIEQAIKNQARVTQSDIQTVVDKAVDTRRQAVTRALREAIALSRTVH